MLLDRSGDRRRDGFTPNRKTRIGRSGEWIKPTSVASRSTPLILHLKIEQANAYLVSAVNRRCNPGSAARSHRHYLSSTFLYCSRLRLRLRIQPRVDIGVHCPIAVLVVSWRLEAWHMMPNAAIRCGPRQRDTRGSGTGPDRPRGPPLTDLGVPRYPSINHCRSSVMFLM
jgi:hypothetical protein